MNTLETFEIGGHASTLAGVAMGALVATLASFAASWHERWLHRREREEDAALLFGELFHSLRAYLEVVRDAHGRGEPFGPITLRMLRAVRREVDVYDRNRERLFQVRDARLRLDSVGLTARFTFALDRILDLSEALAAGPSDPALADFAENREQAFEFLMESSDALVPLVARFGALARVDFSRFSARPDAPAAAG